MSKSAADTIIWNLKNRGEMETKHKVIAMVTNPLEARIAELEESLRLEQGHTNEVALGSFRQAREDHQRIATLTEKLEDAQNLIEHLESKLECRGG